MALVKEDQGDASAGAQTRYAISLGDSFQGTIGPGESGDWIRVKLARGTIYDISITASEAHSFRVIAPGGNQLYPARTGFFSGEKFIFSPAVSGVHYIDVSKPQVLSDYPGEYEISFLENTIPTGTYDDVADYLLDGSDSGVWARETREAFDVEPGGVLTVDITELTEQGQQLARWALDAWTNVTGIRFDEVDGGFAHITFDDEAGAAFVIRDTTDDGVIVSAGVVVPKAWITPEDWLPEHGARMDDHFFWTYIHEIGHALGLIHPGPYNGLGTYGVDNAFLIDSYQVSVMSYIDQKSNTYINANHAFPVTPMIADIIAIQNLYGAPTNINAGDTVYGYRSDVEGYLGEFFALLTGEANPFVSFNVGSRSAPAFADLDGDGDPDLVAGNGNGGIHYFENTGSAGNPGFTERGGRANPLHSVDAGSNSTPAFADLDGDGDLDLVAGNGNGDIHYFENNGSAGNPRFAERSGYANPLDSVDVGSNSTPAFADLDGDGDPDLVVGNGNGDIRYFENTGGAGNPRFAERSGSANPLESIAEVNFSALVFADLDSDGDLDLVMGIRDRTIDYYENTGTVASPDFTERSGAANPLGGVVIGYANAPAFADLDGDGDLDLSVGNGDSGGIHYYENSGTRADADFTATSFGRATTLTLYDNGGEDTLDLRTDITDQRVDLRPEKISNVYGLVGNLVIARGTLIENYIAGSGNDLVIGNAAANRLDGREGNDVLIGLSGADTLVGGGGSDTASWSGSSTGVRVSLQASSAVGGDAAGDSFGRTETVVYRDKDGNNREAVLPDIEHLSGSAHADTLTGDHRDNVIKGAAGNDALYGGPGGGDDVLYGGAGNDKLYGGVGADTLSGGAGDDRLVGGPGDDALRGGAGDDVFSFRSGQGNDVIFDFTDNQDLIDLSDAGLSGFDALSLSSASNGTSIGFDGGTVLLQGFDVANLDAADFLF